MPSSPFQDRVLSLLAEWDERRRRGEDVPLENLCQDHPDLAEEIRRQVDLQERLSRLAEATSGVEEPAGLSSATLPAAGPGAEVLAPPQGAGELGRLGQYRILKSLGQGGMGVVFEAEDLKLKRRVALKAMLPAQAATASAGRRFLREAQAMAAVKHDHVVTIYQVDEERGVPFLAMELLRGEPLDVRLNRAGKLPVVEALRIGREIAEGLAAAHEQGLIHRDIKPGNVWLEAPRDRVKILDFGLARAASPDAGLTQEGAILGTPAYMSPEQTRGEPMDARSDLFSLGVVVYRLLTGEQPFLGKDMVSTLLAVASHQQPCLARVNPEVPRELSELVAKLLEKDPARRPASAAAVAESLRALEQSAGRREGRPPRRRLLLAVAALLLFGLIGAGAFALIRVQGEQGDYVIDTDDPDFSVRVNKGAVTLEDRKTGRKYDLKVVRQDKKEGEHELEVTDADAGLTFKTKTFTVKRGEKVALKAWFERKQEAVKRGVDDAWVKRVNVLPAEEQMKEVVAKLKELNPGFDGKVEHKAEDEVVTEFRVITDRVTDISPVRAFASLRILDCGGTRGTDHRRGNGQLADLMPLMGMNLAGLTTLNLSWTKVSDRDLACFKDCKNLKWLGLHDTKVTDAVVAHLEGCKNLEQLYLNNTKITDTGLARFARCKNLTVLQLGWTQVRDLSSLKGLPLRALLCSNTPVTDLSALKGMKLTSLSCEGTRVADLSPLNGMPLTALACDFRPERDTEGLRSIKTLEFINGKPAAKFWKETEARQTAFQAWLKQTSALPAEEQVKAVAAKLKELNPGFDGNAEHKAQGGVVTEIRLLTDAVTDISPLRALPGLQELQCAGTWVGAEGKGQVSDLSPLGGMKLSVLDCSGNKVSDLSPLRGMPLVRLACRTTRVSDLSPLKDLPLRHLHFSQTNVTDLSPLKGKPLTHLDFWGASVSDLSPLEGMPLAHLNCGGTKAWNLSPLKGMKLTYLACHATPVTDLTVLREMPLIKLTCDFKYERDAEVFRAIKTLETINGKPAAEFWKEAEARQTAFQAWLKQTAALPAEEQVKAVTAKLKELNPGFDGKLEHQAKGGVVTEVRLVTDAVTDISPVRALSGLQKVDCSGRWVGSEWNGRLVDLSPLRGLKLTEFSCHGTRVFDLSPLQGMPLTILSCGRTNVSDLLPLKGMMLTSLNCGATRVTDLSPLTGMPLTNLTCGITHISDLLPLNGMKLVFLNIADSKVSDLSPLQGMPLTTLYCGRMNVTDLSPLRGMPLVTLHCNRTPVSDLSPLKGMKLTCLHCGGTQVTDLSLLKWMPLKELSCDFKPERDAESLRSLKTLETINGKPAAEFWKEVDAMKP